MKLGIVTDIPILQRGDQLVAREHEMLDIAPFAPYFDEIIFFSPRLPLDADAPNLFTCPRQNMRVVQIEGFWPKIYGYAVTWPRVWRSLRAVLPQADLVNVRLPRLCGLIGPDLCRALKLPYFITIIGDWREQFRIGVGRGGWRGLLLPPLAWLPETLTNRACRDAVVFTTSLDILARVKRYARHAFPVYISLLKESQLAQHPKTLSPDRPLRLLYVGVVAPHKGLPDAFAALRVLRDRGVRFEFHVVGDGPMMADARALAEEVAPVGRVVLHGFVRWGPQLLEQYAGADVFLFPSLSEGSPKVVLEAMFNALVVVATPVGAIPTVVEDGVNGRLTPVQDSAALANALCEIAGDAPRFAAMSAAALARARTITQENVYAGWVRQLRQTGLYQPAGDGRAPAETLAAAGLAGDGELM